MHRLDAGSSLGTALLHLRDGRQSWGGKLTPAIECECYLAEELPV